MSQPPYWRRFVPPCGEARRLGELLDVEEVHPALAQLGVEERVVEVDQPGRLQQIGGVDHLLAGLPVQRRVVGDPQEQRPRIGVHAEIGRAVDHRLDDRGGDDRLAGSRHGRQGER